MSFRPAEGEKIFKEEVDLGDDASSEFCLCKKRKAEIVAIKCEFG
jgi:hypothetical protein